MTQGAEKDGVPMIYLECRCDPRGPPGAGGGEEKFLTLPRCLARFLSVIVIVLAPNFDAKSIPG